MIVEGASRDLTVLSCDAEGQAFRAEPLTTGHVLQLPEIGIELPVEEFYADTDLPVEDQ